ncbi:hypothetical protein AcV7_009726 [Taiwanofungus camphoratus]|nr:hypothetical protein AcW2_007415 [Antrodia cinnamomea]KAI0947261.1 hypothetical protein AcV7_009726 [Antrodia cinnamomea]
MAHWRRTFHLSSLQFQLNRSISLRAYSSISNILNPPAPSVTYYTPSQYPASGTAVDPQPSGKPIPTLFKPLKIRSLEFHNRLWLSPMCQYSADDGKLTD